MSRICVKGLPKHAAEDRLREFFSQKGEVTDAKLIRTSDGKSRQFAFVGYRTEEEAEEAIKYFNRSFMDTCRITCEIARKVGDENIPRPWSKHSLKKQEKLTNEGKKETGKKSNDDPGSKKDKKKSKTEGKGDDPLLQEFLEVMKPRSKSKLWANDTVTAPSLEQSKITTSKKKQADKGEEKSSLTDTNSEDNDEKEDESSASEEADKPVNLVHNEVVSDMDYFKSRVKKEFSDSESNEDDVSDNSSDLDSDNDVDDAPDNLSRKSSKTISVENAHQQNASSMEVEGGPSKDSDSELGDPSDPSSSPKGDKDEVLETPRLFVRNLPYTTNEEELEEHFRRFGKVSEVHIVVDKETKRSKGFAYILYSVLDSAARALEELDMSTFQGRLLHVMPAKQKNSSEKQEINTSIQQSSKTLKQRREEERKASEASGNTQAWNTLFMRPDTVVENIARKFGVSKSDFLDKESDDLAVRIALGETQVIAETKKALPKAGINVASLEDFAAGKTDGTKRSNYVILVKNLPYGSSESELANLFGKFGSLDKVILPPTKTLALVIFLEPNEARSAFRGLAYKRYKDAPLYLEWAPGNILDQNLSMDDLNDKSAVGEHDAKRVLLEQQVEELTDVDVDPDRIESRSLYVKNLNFKTSDESLKKHFTEHMKEGKLLSARVKKHLKNGKSVSMGFGFIEFDSVDTAVNVSRDLQGTVLDGHALILQLCHAKEEKVVKKVDNDRSSTKLIVRNVAFEATEKDLRQLFSPFGQIKRLRLPMRFGNHRGFAFVEFVTKQETLNALQALSNTHLYGRHLVLERAKEGESLEELRARTAAQFTDDAQTGYPNSAKISKKRNHLAAFDEGSDKFE